MTKATILCVDDTQSNIDVLMEILSDYELVVALDGENALTLLQRIPVDMILLDIMMPGMDGFTLCEKIKEQETLKDIPLLFLSAKGDEASIEKGYELGAVDYVTKPFKPKELLARVKTHLQLRALVENLEDEVEKTLQKQRTQEHLLVKQSYAASMGQMIDVVAHQWMQPLNVVNMRMSKLLLDYDDELVDRTYLETLQSRSLHQIHHLVQTLNEFRSFMSPHKPSEYFNLQAMLNKTMLLIQDEMKQHHIKVEIMRGDDFEVYAIENEFIHILLNLLNNAKEAFELNNLKNRSIKIDVDSSQRSLSVRDNAKGIDPTLLENIFDLHFTSKKSSGGSGLGLYMSKMIIEKYGGSISAENTEEGACFSIQLP